jgi:hypothetical protein
VATLRPMSMVTANCVWIFVRGVAAMTTYCFYQPVHFYFLRDKTHSRQIMSAGGSKECSSDNNHQSGRLLSSMNKKV